MKLYHLGIMDDVNPYVNHKKKLTNQVAIMCAFIGFFYSFFIYAHYEVLVVYPVILFFISSGLLALNYYGFFQTARFLASFQMLVLASLFHASIIPASDALLAPFFSSMIAMTLIPFVLYSFQEKRALAVSLSICWGLLLAQGFLNRQFELSVDPTYFRVSYLGIMTYAFAAGIAILLVVMIVNDKSRNHKLQLPN